MPRDSRNRQDCRAPRGVPTVDVPPSVADMKLASGQFPTHELRQQHTRAGLRNSDGYSRVVTHSMRSIGSSRKSGRAFARLLPVVACRADVGLVVAITIKNQPSSNDGTSRRHIFNWKFLSVAVDTAGRR